MSNPVKKLTGSAHVLYQYMSIYMGDAKSSKEKGHKTFCRDFGGKVFIVEPVNGSVSERIERQIKDEAKLLLQLPKRE